MRYGGNNFYYFFENKLTSLANLVQFKRFSIITETDKTGNVKTNPLHEP